MYHFLKDLKKLTIDRSINPVSSSEFSDITGRAVFRYNFIDVHSNIDEDNNGIADDRYPVYSLITSFLQDPYPTAVPNPADIQFRPPSIITSPSDGSTLNETTLIQWSQDLSYSNLNVSFQIEIQQEDSAEWQLIIDNIFGQTYLWDPSTIQNANYQLRVVSNDTVGFSQFSEIIIVTILIPPPDSDGDGLPDEDEINIYGTDPFKADTDNDGLRDDDELNVYGTDPLDDDSDDDGWIDGVEIAQGFDPLDPESHPENISGSITTLGEGEDSPIDRFGLLALAGSVLLGAGYIGTKSVRRYRSLSKKEAIDYLERAQSMVDDHDPD